MVWSMEIFTKSAKETKEFGQNFANKLKGGEVLALVGDLGSGKTTFVQGLARGLGISGMITSPTFILMRDYDTGGEKKEIKKLYHLDLYRLEDNINKEVENLGLDDLLGKMENVVVIEWADKAREVLPKDTIWIDFEFSEDVGRKIKVHIANNHETIY